MLGTTRGLATLIGGLVAGLLIWRAAEATGTSAGDYWAAIALAAGAGLVFGLAQQVTTGNIGFHRRFVGLGVAPGMFLLAFVPLAIIGGWIILAGDPGWWGANVNDWSADWGIASFVALMTLYAPLIAFGLGATLALSLYNEVFEPEVEPEVVEKEVVETEDTPAPVARATAAAPADEDPLDRDLIAARERVREPERVEPELVTAEPVDDYSRADLRREPVRDER